MRCEERNVLYTEGLVHKLQSDLSDAQDGLESGDADLTATRSEVMRLMRDAIGEVSSYMVVPPSTGEMGLLAAFSMRSDVTRDEYDAAICEHGSNYQFRKAVLELAARRGIDMDNWTFQEVGTACLRTAERKLGNVLDRYATDEPRDDRLLHQMYVDAVDGMTGEGSEFSVLFPDE